MWFAKDHGSGTPKGAVIPHAQLCTTMKHLHERIGTAGGVMRTFQMTLCNLDFAIFEIFCSLVARGLRLRPVRVRSNGQSRRRIRWPRCQHRELFTLLHENIGRGRLFKAENHRPGRRACARRSIGLLDYPRSKSDPSIRTIGMHRVLLFSRCEHSRIL